MSRAANASLRYRLVCRLVPLQSALLAVFSLLIVGTLCATGLLIHERDEDRVIYTLQDALARDDAGALVLRPTEHMQTLRKDTPDLWFAIRDQEGRTLTEGAVPPAFAALGPAIDHIGQAKFGWDRLRDKSRNFNAQMKRADTAAGDVQIIATTDGKSSRLNSLIRAGLIFLGLTLPGLVLMSLATWFATPLVVKNALAGLDEAADQAREIDIGKRGTRLPVETVPAEISPLVNAVNDALGRLDEGYARHRRFLADAAHELRTPIAILTTRLESLPPGLDKRRLVEDVARLANLTDQLLDLQRLEHRLAELSSVNLADLCEQVIADLAPMAIAAGYNISLQREAEPVEAWGDRSSLERAVVNLVQNAIQHGGRDGAIIVAVRSPAVIEVRDQGPGIPSSQREQVFEPFHRLQPLSRGAGLGLNLVRDIVRLHNGEVVIVDGPRGGACFRMTLPPVGIPFLVAG